MTHIKKPLSAVNVFVIVFAIFLIIEGFWGLFSPVVFGILSTNILHAVIHLFLGFGGLFLGLRNRGRNYSLFIGILLLTVGMLFFVPASGDLIIQLLNVNKAVATLNIIIGIIAILLAVLTPKAPVPHAGKHN